MFEKLCKTQDSELLECKADLGKRDHMPSFIIKGILNEDGLMQPTKN